MSIASQKYVRKPIYVDAVQVTQQNFNEIAAWCQGEIQADGGKQFIKVRVHNPKNPRQTKAFVGDWLLYTERGYKVYTNKAFHSSFDRLEAEVTAQPGMSVSAAGPVQTATNAVEGPVVEQKLELVPATPQTIADEVSHQEAVREHHAADLAKGQKAKPVHAVTEVAPPIPTVDDVPEQESIQPAAAEGKRVLSVAEQEELTSTEVRDLIQSGEVVLAQDLARS